MPKENITIKDIAARAGVSTGTVDRVLHKRPNVSKTALDKVNKALEELDYRPNMYADIQFLCGAAQARAGGLLGRD